MHLFGIFIVVLIGGAWIVGAFAIGCFQPKQTPRLIRCARALAALGMAVGASGFFGAALAATGGLNWLPKSFEWPIGFASDVIVLQDKYYIVPHRPTGRIQVYDADLRFVRGWQVDAGGGTFQLVASNEESIDVFTARGNHHYRYAIDGTLISERSYNPEDYSTLPNDGISLTIPTRWWLWPFTNPFFSWALALGGLAGVGLTDKVTRKRDNR